MHCTRKVTDDLIWVGADDRRLFCFEGVYGVPDGVSYNSYLLLDEKTVLFDTVDKAVYSVFLENVAYALGGRKLDYLVVHHMEPDHAATQELILARYPEAKIVCNQKIQTMMKNYLGVDYSDRTILVKEGDSLSTGRHNLSFVMAPMVHWPEVMMSYDTTDKILFTADAFGTFGALNGRLFNDETDFFAEDIDEARRYYTNIVGKYGPQVQNVLKKAAKLDIALVCPLHGYVWRSHFGDFLEKYLLWSSYTPEEKSVLLAYASVYGHTENATNILACRLQERGVRVRMYDTSVTPASYIVSDAFRCSHLVFAATTYNAGVFVTMEQLLHDLAAHNVQNRKVAIIENGSWAPTSGKVMRDIIAPLKNIEFLDGQITLKSALAEEQLAQLDALADAIAADINPAPALVESLVEPAVFSPEAVDNKVFSKMSYGVEVLTTRVDGKDYGCIINTACQVASGDPKKLTISVIKKNNTCDMVARAGKFNISILTEDAPYSLFQHFGFQSGRDVDKFADVPYEDRMGNGIRYIPTYTNAVLSCEVIDVRDLETQVLYIANVVEAKVLSKAPSCTYGYYHAHIKPKKNPAPEQKECWVCRVCGYV
ncbi:MAG: flavin reductase, partial [Selenomonas sp.]|nr:flavin reductase [Selenomonas sp.]